MGKALVLTVFVDDIFDGGLDDGAAISLDARHVVGDLVGDDFDALGVEVNVIEQFVEPLDAPLVFLLLHLATDNENSTDLIQSKPHYNDHRYNGSPL